MSRVLSVRPCDRCGVPSERDIRDRRCDPCDRAAAVEANRRYRMTPKGRRKYRQRHLQPAWKVRAAKYADEHPETIRAAAARYRAKHARSGTVLPCATLGCKGAFVRTRFNGSQKFGDDCDCARLSMQYSTQASRNRYERRTRRRIWARAA